MDKRWRVPHFPISISLKGFLGLSAQKLFFFKVSGSWLFNSKCVWFFAAFSHPKNVVFNNSYIKTKDNANERLFIFNSLFAFISINKILMIVHVRSFQKGRWHKKTIKYLYLKKGNYIFKAFWKENYHKIMTWLS